jgi:menaquinone-9 beta-reductase
LLFDFDPIFDGIPGYAWIFPYAKEGQEVRYKIGVMDGRGVASGEALREWTLKYAASRGYRLADERVAGWPERYFDSDVRASAPGLLLVGEAWGIDALLGEGIAPALFTAEYAARRLKAALDRGNREVKGYETAFLAEREGLNLWFQARLADRLYGRHPFRWLRVMFELPYLKHLSGRGSEAYGRLAHHMPSLTARYLASVVRHGMPSNDKPR